MAKKSAPAARDSTVEPDFFSTQITTARRFFLTLDPHPADPLAVVCGGLEDTDANYHIQRPSFRFFTLELVTRGAGTLRLNNRTCALAPGTIFAYGPRIAHEFSSAPANPLHKYFVNFSGTAVPRLLAPPGPRPGQVLQTSQPRHLVELFEELIDAARRQSPFRARICSAILTHILLRVAETAVPLGALGSDAFATYQLARAFIDTHHLRLTALSEIADHCRIDAAYLCRLFKRFDHQGPWQTVLRLKMHAAASRLAVPNVRVSDVANAMGFSDPFQFSRTFRRVIGLSPRAFARSQHLSE